MGRTANRIPGALMRLETALAGGASPDDLAALGEPAFVAFLFQIELRRQIRLGPAAAKDGGLDPARLLAASRQGAAAGVLPLSTPLELERFLAELERRIHASGAWRPDHPLWWRSPGAVTETPPRPFAATAESAYRALERGPDGRVPSRESLAHSFGSDASRRWLLAPSVVPLSLCATLHLELETALAAGDLVLEAGTVGKGRRSNARSDAVTYLTGLEPELLERVPRLAALAQWCLARLVPELAARLPGASVHAPVTAMLARYPGSSEGYRAHLDNPGGPAENGRELAVLLYLNPPEAACVGGELAVWAAGRSSGSPADEELAPTGGSLALVDARRVAHRVRPLGDGPARWSLALWLNSESQGRFEPPPAPDLGLTDVLLPVDAPPLPVGSILRHELDDEPGGTIAVHRRVEARPRTGIVATVYDAGADLDRWCRHHLRLGFDHLVLIFDHLEEPAEAATAERLVGAHPASSLTVWSGTETARERWAASSGEAALRRAAGAGSAPQAVAARQTLNATAGLAAASSGELGGEPLDWLLHLDADELFHLEGDARGGADSASHFAMLTALGTTSARYVNHELLLPHAPGEPPRFKRNPRLAAAVLGATGWERLAAGLRMRQSDPRPYFNGYLNGKSAVAVAAGVEAAGVHAWVTRRGESRLLAGPSVLHYHFASARRYRRKYLAMAGEVEGGGDDGLFEPCRTEVEGWDLARELRRAGASDEEASGRLLRLRDRLSGFGKDEAELLDHAGLLLRPEVGGGLGVDGPVPDMGEPATRGRRRTVSVRDARTVTTVGIVGGGTAGYLAALALRRRCPAIAVSLIESSQIPVIGVGEATTPLLPQFLHVDLGLDVGELFRQVRPTLKLGIRFDWSPRDDGWFNYPFGSMDLVEALFYDDDVRNCSLRSLMMSQGAVPLTPRGDGGWRSELDTEIGYHLDNRRFVGYLRRQAEERGVERIERTISRVETSTARDRVDALIDADGRRLSFEVYVDCSGFRSLLLGDAMASPFVSYEASLFADRALVASAPHGGAVLPYTRALKMSSGWCWTTPQRREDHLGYVFSSAFLDSDRAEAEMRARHPAMGEPRTVRFRSGRHEHFRRGNVFALGNAYGFVEPLESTALHMLVRQIGMMTSVLGRETGTASGRRELDHRVGAYWDYLSWFLALHYRFDAERATPFWRACVRQVDVSRHGELIEVFRRRGPLAVSSGGFDYPDPLWGPEGVDLLLMGQGVASAPARPRTAVETWRQRVRRWQRVVERSPAHGAALGALDGGPLLEPFADALRAAGPAFPS